MLPLSASRAFADTRRTSVSSTSREDWRCPLSHHPGQKGRRRTGRGSRICSWVAACIPLLLTEGRSDLVGNRTVPNLHGGYFAVVAQHAKCARSQEKVLTSARWQPYPACNAQAQHMPVDKQTH